MSVNEFAIQAVNLHKSYAGVEVLKGVSLLAKKHEVVSIIGASGSGKSTLLRCLNFLELPDSGSISVEGEILDLSSDKHDYRSRRVQRQINNIRRHSGMVFQQFNLWCHMTVLENVMLGPCCVLGRAREEVEIHAKSLLERVGMLDKCHSYPDNLSGGQKQRVSIARTLCMDPQIMLFDEPTSALDPELVNEVLQVISELAAQGRTMILVTHEMRFAREVSSQTLYLHQGKIVEQGETEQLFSNPQTKQLQQFLSN